MELTANGEIHTRIKGGQIVHTMRPGEPGHDFWLAVITEIKTTGRWLGRD